jgi:hypothetical protein
MMENAGYNMKTPNLKIILEMITGEEAPKMTRQEKTEFLESVKNFSALGESVYGKNNLQELCERVRDIVDKGQRVMTESGDWFESVEHKKGFKRIEEDYKMFEETAKEMSRLQERLSIAYENIGQGLSRYYDMD